MDKLYADWEGNVRDLDIMRRYAEALLFILDFFLTAIAMRWSFDIFPWNLLILAFWYCPV